MKLIPLTQGKFAKVDDEDYDFLMQWKWMAAKNSITKNFYATRNSPFVNGKRFEIRMHRILMKVVDSNIVIDHIDRVTLNNQKANLRRCSKGENNRNRKSSEHSTSMYLGVHIRMGIGNQTPVYEAGIRTNNNRIYLGRFPLTTEGEIAAAKAYDAAAKKYHGEFANLNFK